MYNTIYKNIFENIQAIEKGTDKMEFLELAKKRYSVRKYKDTPVEEEKLAKILEAARVAPTGKNAQPVKLIVVKEKENLDKLSKGANFYGAPVVVIACCDTTKSWVRPFDGKNISDIDATILTTHMMLEATELGLGSVWLCRFEKEVIKQEFGIPENVDVVNLLAIGYADDEPKSPERHSEMRVPMEELVRNEKF